MSSNNITNPNNNADLPEPPPYEEIINNFNVPPLIEGGEQLRYSVVCEVCQKVINLNHDQNTLVVKCNNCNETMPIKPAPPGIKFVRCTCKELLICQSDANRVICSRPTCRVLIMFGPSTVVSSAVTSQTHLLNQQIRVNCAHCSGTFILNVGRKKRCIYAKCPHCLRNSSVGKYYVRVWMIIYLVLGFLMVSVGVGLSIVTYFVTIGLLIVGTLMIVRGFLFCCVKVSTKEETLIPAG